MGLFNWKKKKEEKSSYTNLEPDEVVKAVEDFLAKMDETPPEPNDVINGEERRRQLPEISEAFKRLQGCNVFTMAEIISAKPFEVDLFQLVLMENGFGERYFNIIRNGIVDKNYNSYALVMNSKYFIQTFTPWLEGKTDYIPQQGYDDLAAIFKRVEEIKAQQERS